MQINLMTDCALRMLIFLAIKHGVANSRKLAEQLDIPQKNILEIGRKLKAENYIDATVGPYGGYTLNKTPDTILLYDIVCLFEKININCHSESEKGKQIEIDAAVNGLYSELQDMIITTLKSKTLADIVPEQQTVRKGVRFET